MKDSPSMRIQRMYNSNSIRVRIKGDCMKKILALILLTISVFHCSNKKDNDSDNLLLLLFLTSNQTCKIKTDSLEWSAPYNSLSGSGSSRGSNSINGTKETLYYGLLKFSALKAGDILVFNQAAVTPYIPASGTTCDFVNTTRSPVTSSGVTTTASSDRINGVPFETSATITSAGDYFFSVVGAKENTSVLKR